VGFGLFVFHALIVAASWGGSLGPSCCRVQRESRRASAATPTRPEARRS
jgi:hypothetical protein